MHLKLGEMQRLNGRLRAPRPARVPSVRAGDTCVHLPNWTHIPNEPALLSEPTARLGKLPNLFRLIV